MLTDREKIIRDLKNIVINEYMSELNMNVPNYDKLADFIIEDRRRIVDPLVKAYIREDFPKMSLNGQLNSLYEGTVETLKNAGVQ